MNYEEFHRHIGKAGLTLGSFAGLLKMHPSSISNLKQRVEVPTHLAVIAALLGEMAEHKVDFRETLGRIVISAKRPRGARTGKFDNTSKNLDSE